MVGNEPLSDVFLPKLPEQESHVLHVIQNGPEEQLSERMVDMVLVFAVTFSVCHFVLKVVLYDEIIVITS